MKKLLLILTLFVICTITVCADTDAPILEFKCVGGGHFIYCNNPEAIDANTLMNGENPRYVMNNDNLRSGKYYIYLSHYNYIGMKNGVENGISHDMELDVELTPIGNCEYTLINIAFETSKPYAYYDKGYNHVRTETSWGMFDCNAKALHKNLIDLNGNEFYPYDGENKEYNIKADSTRWLSEFIPNYCTVSCRKAVHIQAVLEIKSGSMNVNVCAFEAPETLGDRSSMPENAERGIVRYDRTIKGVADTLPQVTADLEYTIDDSTENNTYLPVTMYNVYAPDGVTNYSWVTHISALDDPWAKTLADDSGMLAFTYKDKNKLNYYGKNVPQSERSDIWHFDISHTDTHSYENQPAAKSADLYCPNYEITANDNVNGFATNLGNYGVTYTYNLKIKNNGNTKRYFTYEPTTKSNIIVYTNLDGRESNYGFIKNSNQDEKPDIMSVVELPPHSEREFSINVILPVNYNGGIRNAFVIHDNAEKLDFDTVYANHREYEKTPTTNGKLLYEYKDKLPKETYDKFYGLFNDYEVADCETFYALRWFAWDGMEYPNPIPETKRIYILDKDFNITGSHDFEKSPIGMVSNGGDIYVIIRYQPFSNVFSSSDGIKYEKEQFLEDLPKIPMKIKYGEKLNSDPSPHYINISGAGCLTYLTDNDYKILYEALKDMTLKWIYIQHTSSEGIPVITIDGGKGYKGLDYAFINNADSYKADWFANYFLYFGENADASRLELSDWAYNDFKTAMEYGFISTRLLTYGGPRSVIRGITRDDFCTVAYNMLSYLGTVSFNTELNSSFSDTSSRTIRQMADLGIIKGYEDGMFRPDNTITRQEAAVILSRMLNLFGMNEKTNISFSDDDLIQEWAEEGLANSVAYGIMKGVEDNKFAPDDTYTVEQSVVTMLREFNAITDTGYFNIPDVDEIKGNATNYIVYREGYRNNRIELCTYESDETGEVINDNGNLYVNGKFENCKKYFFHNGEWIWFESGYDKISNNATAVFAKGKY